MKAEWYAIPPYTNEGWCIFNEKGELIATFETKEDCILAVKLFNENKNEDEAIAIAEKKAQDELDCAKIDEVYCYE